MEIWIDAQLSPAIALWLNQSFPDINARSVRSIGLLSADDETIFLKAREEKAIVVSKDADFVNLLEQLGPPPQIIWITAGNTSNSRMREILTKHMPTIIEMINNGEPLIEITGD